MRYANALTPAEVETATREAFAIATADKNGTRSVGSAVQILRMSSPVHLRITTGIRATYSSERHWTSNSFRHPSLLPLLSWPVPLPIRRSSPLLQYHIHRKTRWETRLYSQELGEAASTVHGEGPGIEQRH